MKTLKHFLLFQLLGLILGLILNLLYIICGLGYFYATYAIFAILFAAIWFVYELAQWYVRTMIKDFENSQLIKNNEKQRKTMKNDEKHFVEILKKETFEAIFIEKLKERNINFDKNGRNYIDDDFNSVFDAAFSTFEFILNK